MSKKFFKALSALLAMVITCAWVTGCTQSSGPAKPQEEDNTISYLYVQNYDGGPGYAWLNEVADRFEEYYKDTVFEEGKKGVDVKVTSDKTATLSGLKNSYQQVWFFNNVYYNNYIFQNDFVDITDMVKETLPGESVTLESKLPEDMKKALTAADSGKYYALPTHQCLAGVTYNKAIFDSKGFYLLDDETLSGVPATDARYGFITVPSVKAQVNNGTIKKSTGPDGLYGTDDDGLPSSVEEFKRLCKCMAQLGVTPFICYASSGHYTSNLADALWASLEGYDGAMLNFSFDSNKNGTTDLITGFNGDTPIIAKDQTINVDEGYKVYSQASRYYALDLMQFLFNKDDLTTYMTSESVQSGLNHTGAQYEFLKGESADKPVGMILEGSYWENESKAANNFANLKTLYPDVYDELDYRFMPLPHQYTGRVTPIGTVGEGGITRADGYEQVGLDNLYYYCFINSYAVEGDAAATNIAKKFIQFCYTDETLQKSNIETSLTLGVNYSLTDEQYNSLSPYAKSLYDIKKYGKIISQTADTKLYIDNMAKFKVTTLGSEFWGNDLNKVYPFTAFKEDDKLTAKTFFENVVSYHDAEWWGTLYR